ncbi:metallophosphoesterase [Romboutsia sp.]|uniref:metallophosphoesterase n=1 Tax=Romboutsia sp. TaxID=1965302 RepID=UPI003F319392
MAKLKIRRSNFKDKIYVLSDIHMGTNAPTVLYRRDFHEPYLIAAINYIINNASNVEMVVLLGDIFDFGYTHQKKTLQHLMIY